MPLTKEQEELIERNKKRALELRIKHQAKLKAEAVKAARETNDSNKRQRAEENTSDGDEKEKDDEIVLEDFEMGASPLVSKREAMQTYCLPEGTLAVCSFVEKPNPRHKSWTPMKLYDRKEIRTRARKRFGGLEGLQAERKKRRQAQLQRDLQKAKNIFR